MRYELTDHEWIAIKPMLPNKPHGVPRINDRRVLNGIFWVLRSGAPWRDYPRSSAHTPCYNRFVRWGRAGVCSRLWANIPPRCNHNQPICFSAHLYRARNRAERFFSRIKQCRRVATRYDKLAANYLAFLQLASIRIWLRVDESTS